MVSYKAINTLQTIELTQQEFLYGKESILTAAAIYCQILLIR